MLSAPSADLIFVCRAFSELQHARHSADYDHEYRLRRRVAVELVEKAWDAHEQAERMREDGDVSYRIFCGLALGGAQIIKQRRD